MLPSGMLKSAIFTLLDVTTAPLTRVVFDGGIEQSLSSRQWFARAGQRNRSPVSFPNREGGESPSAGFICPRNSCRSI